MDLDVDIQYQIPETQIFNIYFIHLVIQIHFKQ